MQHPATTSESLLTRLTQANADPAAWSHFVEVYGLQIVQWCRSYGLQDADAQDLAQDVLVRFWRQARNFQYKPGRYFRGYLHKVARTALWQWKVRLKEGDIGAGGEQMHQRLRLIPAKEDLLARLEQAGSTPITGGRLSWWCWRKGLAQTQQRSWELKPMPCTWPGFACKE